MNEITTGELTIDHMKQIAYDAMLKSKKSVSIEIKVWAFRCEEEPQSTVRLFYSCDNKDTEFRNLRELSCSI